MQELNEPARGVEGGCRFAEERMQDSQVRTQWCKTIHPYRCWMRVIRRVTVPHDARGPTDDVSLLWRISMHHAQDDEIMRVPFQDVRQIPHISPSVCIATF